MEYANECTQEYKTDIIEKEFGLLTVKELVDIKRYAARYRYFYRCLCKCGNHKIVERSNLVGAAAHTTSCGCLKKRTGKDNPTWNGHGEISGRFWSSICIGAKERGLSMEISPDDAWELFKKQNGKCALTGEPLTLKIIKGSYSERTASLDRIDNTYGYKKGNVQWVHKDVNWMKGKFSLSQFVELCGKVAKYAA